MLSDTLTGENVTEAFEAAHHSAEAREMMQAFFVGNYIDVSVFCADYLHAVLRLSNSSYDLLHSALHYHLDLH